MRMMRGFRAIATRPEFALFPATSALYEVVHQSGTIPAGDVIPAGDAVPAG
jgi:hypothetical protein